LLLADVIIRHLLFVEDDNILDEQQKIAKASFCMQKYFSHRTFPLESDANMPPKQRTAKMMKVVFVLRFS
jgi:hypothetical protein